MKTFRMIGMALFAVLMCVNFASCSSDDEDEEEVGTKTYAELIIGTWEEDGNDGGTFTFKKDGSLVYIWSDGDKEEGTWSISGSTLKLSLTYEGDNGKETDSWSETIKSLDDKKLVLEYYDDEEGYETTVYYRK